MIAPCPTEQRLREFSLGQLDEEQSDLMFSHVSDCVQCQDSMTTQEDDTLVEKLRETKVNEPDFCDEAECNTAMGRALAVLAHANSDDEFLNQDIPSKIGDYDIVRMIGRGGMGNVYLARHSRLGREVALKVIASHRADDPMVRGRFETEMQAVGKLSHPNIVNALDAREVDGLAVLVTEYIDGLDLGEIVRRTGPLTPANAARIVQQVSNALIAIDQAGLVHRDIKPSNVMISKQGEVKLLDLGLARWQGSNSDRDFTATGQTIGTVDYLAPEQIEGNSDVDVRADIYGLGCTLFKLLTGEVPFGNTLYPNTFAKMTAHVSADPPAVETADVPVALASLTRRMMSKKPVDRPATAQEVAQKLERFSIHADLQSLCERAVLKPAVPIDDRGDHRSTKKESDLLPWWRRRVAVAVAIATGLGGFAGGLFLGIIITIKHPDGTETTLNVPNGSQVTIDEKGDAQVRLPNGTGNLPNERSRSYELPAARGVDLPIGRSVPLDVSHSSDQVNPPTELVGIWRLKIEIDGRTYKENRRHPNLLVIGKDGVAMLHDNQLMAVGEHFALEGTTQLLGLNMRLPDGISARRSIPFWMSKSAVGTLVLENNQRVRLENIHPATKNRNSDTASISFSLERLLIGDDVNEYPAMALQSGNATFRTALRKLFELESEDMAIPASTRKRLDQLKSRDQLFQLVLGLHNYHDSHKHFPASRNVEGNVPDKIAGESPVVYPHSWRVAILPYIGEQELYEQYHFNEKWDSIHNRTVLEQMPDVFRHPADTSNGFNTRYQGICGPGAALGMDHGVRLEDYQDGTSQTILLLEASHFVPWTQPMDVQYDPEDRLHPKQEWLTDDSCLVVFADASIHVMRVDVAREFPGRKILEAYFTRSGGENMSADVFEK